MYRQYTSIVYKNSVVYFTRAVYKQNIQEQHSNLGQYTSRVYKNSIVY